MNDTTPTTFRLGSNAMFNAPGIIRWAIIGYAFEDSKANMIEVLVSGWHVPEKAAEALLSKAIPYRVEGETVVFDYHA